MAARELRRSRSRRSSSACSCSSGCRTGRRSSPIPNGGGSYTVAKDNLGIDAGARRRGGAAHRLHPHRRRLDLGRRGGDHVGVSARSRRTRCCCASLSIVLLDARQPARRARIGRRVQRADVRVHRDDARADRRRVVSRYSTGHELAPLDGRAHGRSRVGAAARRDRRRSTASRSSTCMLRGFAEGCVGDDGNGSDLERRDGVQGAGAEERRDDARLDGRHPRRFFLGVSFLAQHYARDADGAARRCCRSSGITSSAADGCTTRCSTRRSRSSCSRRTPRSPTSRGWPASSRATATCRASSPRAATGSRSPTASSRSRSSRCCSSWLFHGDTNALVPLYAIGVFVCFTLSQAGMVRALAARRASAGWQLEGRAQRRRRRRDGLVVADRAGGDEVHARRAGSSSLIIPLIILLLRDDPRALRARSPRRSRSSARARSCRCITRWSCR